MNYNHKEAEFEIERKDRIIKKQREQISKLTKALLEIESCPFDIEGFPTASEAANWMNGRATQALSGE